MDKKIKKGMYGYRDAHKKRQILLDVYKRQELTVLSYDRIQDESEIRLRIREGKFHQVKRMMEAVGCPVLFLKRLSMGPLGLDEDLKPRCV